jgi:hypothetical protein
MPKHVVKNALSPEEYAGVVVPLQLAAEEGVLSFFNTTTVFGTPVDITLSELALESFFPAESATAEILRRLAQNTETEDTAGGRPMINDR